MRARTPAARVVVAALGAGFVAAWASGRAALFVRPWFAPVMAVAGALLIVAAWRGRAALTPATAGILLLPLVAGLALGPGLAGRIPPGPGNGQLPSRLGDSAQRLLTADGGGAVTLLDIALAERRVGAAFLEGRRVVVDGTVNGPNEIGRLAMVCCAADARPVTLEVVGTLPSEGTWVRVTGHLSARGGRVVLAATSVLRIPTPANPFL